MNWKFWKKKEPAPQQRIYPFIHISIVEENKVEITTRWPRPDSQAHADRICETFGNLIYMVNSGELLPLFQQSVTNAGETTKDDGMAFHVLRVLNHNLGAAGSKKKNPNRPMIHPLAAFGVNENDSSPSHLRQ